MHCPSVNFSNEGTGGQLNTFILVWYYAGRQLNAIRHQRRITVHVCSKIPGIKGIHATYDLTNLLNIYI